MTSGVVCGQVGTNDPNAWASHVAVLMKASVLSGSGSIVFSKGSDKMLVVMITDTFADGFHLHSCFCQ